MEHFELVEKLQAKTNVSFEEAKNALENNNWDLLDAIVALERDGKIKNNADNAKEATPQQFFDEVKEEVAEEVKEEPVAEPKQNYYNYQAYGQASQANDGPAEPKFAKAGEKISSWAETGNRNFLLISRHGKEKTRIPMTVLIVALVLSIAFFPIIPPLFLAFVISLFFGFSYNIVGPNDHSKVNNVMNKVNETADQVKDSVKKEWENISK